jgi:hypothetical protein
MSEITGKLLADLFPDGVVRIAFIPIVGSGPETSLTAKDLDAAESFFMTCGQTPGRAAALRAELDRNKVVSVQTSIDDGVAAKFRRARP